jgi:DNA-binding NarL/FixJ family response regulator
MTRQVIGTALAGSTVLIVDDHRVFADVIARQLTDALPSMTVHVAVKLAEARALARAVRPDVVIVDYNLSGECGLDLVPDLAELDLEAGLVVVSASRDADQIMRAFGRGAQAWVDKAANVDDLIDAMIAVCAGRMYLSSASVRPVIDAHLRASRREATAAEFGARCTDRELDVLRHLMAGMTRAGVAAALGLSPNTVRTHVQSLLHTFGLHSTLALIAAAREAGVSPADVPPRLLVRLT